MVPPRMAASAGGRPARPARPAPATVVLQRRRWPGQDGDQDQDGDTREQMLRRRRLVCSMASFVDEDQDQDNQGGTCAVIDLKDNAAVEVRVRSRLRIIGLELEAGPAQRPAGSCAYGRRG